ncbi:MAE_28990/MAE_18760 family HEPN-like nuclease [Bordetella genomosp. 1]|uniref:MAE_28990/MAE_18760 family HEPN-like nuclease n=1 Tax=Bordetella genomosp. 1 TaxID=1395607 RepID=UPI001140C89F|nr:MAE_28990/MAE_18760 family HEPN-like nuclease [Bordetella genomosp. 1]
MRFNDELERSSREFARIRTEIQNSDSEALSPLTLVRERAVATRAAAYVWLAATLERIVRDALCTAFREISATSPVQQDLRLSLFALLCEGDFASVASRSRSNSWETKIALFQRTVATGPAVLSDEILPLDGRTIRAEHFDTIWLVLGMTAPSVPSPLHRIALKELADGRNEVAHGHDDPVRFGRAKATKDMLNLVARVDDVVTHLLANLDKYVSHKLYLR